jgi:hypothetical protein
MFIKFLLTLYLITIIFGHYIWLHNNIKRSRMHLVHNEFIFAILVHSVLTRFPQSMRAWTHTLHSVYIFLQKRSKKILVRSYDTIPPKIVPAIFIYKYFVIIKSILCLYLFFLSILLLAFIVLHPSPHRALTPRCGQFHALIV